MPYKYIGRTTDFSGKTLWEIVGNLKNFGVGRMIVRQRFERYPEPSYIKILKVEPLTCPEPQNMDNMRKVRVLVERTFRGKTLPQNILMEAATYKADYRLVPKHEEGLYLSKAEETKSRPISVPIYPKTIEFPPLLKELLIREQRARGEDASVEPRLEVVYNKKNYGKYRITKEGETPTVELALGVGKTPNTSLYSNVKPT